MLSKPEAEQLALSQLKSCYPAAVISLAEAAQVERPFGWVFVVHGASEEFDRSASKAVPHMLIVNKYSGQVVASSVAYDLGEFVGRYEKLLAQNQRRSAQWCSTAGFPIPWRWWRKQSVAERAIEGGFYEVRGGESKP